MNDKDKVTDAGAVELDEDELGQARGGYFKGADGLSAEVDTAPQGLECFPKSWKMASLDGKGNDVMTEEITIIAEQVKR